MENSFGIYFALIGVGIGKPGFLRFWVAKAEKMAVERLLNDKTD